MKHSFKITLILLSMFFLTQLIGLFIINQYSPEIVQVIDSQGNIINQTNYNLPYGMDPPSDTTPGSTFFSIIIAVAIAVILMLFLMKFNAEIILKSWFFAVITLALAISINSVLFKSVNYSTLVALAFALPLTYLKIFKRNIFLHNFTELLIYPGIAVIFVPLLNIWTVVLLFILISLYDMYAVWHAGFMQKMAKYQINKLKVFSGFFIPYLNKTQKQTLSKSKKSKKMKVSVAILGGGDVVFPIILAGVVLRQIGFLPAIIISLGATAALAFLFRISKKGKFYPAMPFITSGCFLALGIAYLI